ncbi:MAG: flagellar basal body P-ring protein FlgI, partial [Aeoliella sp.]
MSISTTIYRTGTFALAMVVAFASLEFASAETRLRNICRVKGQEENTLRGLGLVVGLNGTGEAGDRPTMLAIARAMELLGSPVGTNGVLDAAAINELKKIKNASLVIVTATVPATGARRGEKLDCTVAAPTGKSLVGGQLTFATLQGPNIKDGRVFALCNGSVHVEDPNSPNVGRVQNGCQMEQDVFTPFFLQQEDGKYITLVLDEHHASFHAAWAIAEKIEGYYGDSSGRAKQSTAGSPYGQNYVEAIDATNIRVRIPDYYDSHPVQFTYEVLELIINDEDPEARVVINSRTNTIVISGDVRIGDVVVVHDNV